MEKIISLKLVEGDKYLEGMGGVWGWSWFEGTGGNVGRV